MYRPTIQMLAFALVMIVAREASAQSLLDRLGGVLERQFGVPPGEEVRQPGYLGLTADHEGQSGVIVLEVEQATPAAAAGLQAGDRLLSIDDRPLDDLESMAAALEARAAGEQIRITLERAGEQQVVTVTLAPVPGSAPRPGPRGEPGFEEIGPPPEADRAAAAGAFLGVRTTTMTPLLRQRYNLPVERGAVIVGLTPGSPAARAGLPVGGAIVAVDRQPIASHSDLLTLLRDYRAGDQVKLSFYEGRQLVRMQLTLAEPPAQPRAAQFDDDADPTPPPAAPPEDAPEPEADLRIVPLVPGDRPVGRLLNRVLEGVQQIEQVPPRRVDTLVPPPPEEPLVLGPQELQRRVLQLEEYVERLERRVAELEARLDP